jgi:ABC-type spermidine/putrescine transport system permease subunit I
MPARAHGKTALTPWLFLLPFAAVFATFTLYPLVDSVRLAFHRPVGPTAEVYVGWSNFRELMADRQFWQALLRTAYFAVMSLVVQLPVALGMALLVDHRGLRGKGFFRTAFFVPVLIGPAFIGAAFKRIFGLQDGALNQLLGLVGLASIDWLRDPAVVMNTLVLVGVWMFAGFNMVYFLAGLQSVPAELYDAAKVDGAGHLAALCRGHLTGDLAGGGVLDDRVADRLVWIVRSALGADRSRWSGRGFDHGDGVSLQARFHRAGPGLRRGHRLAGDGDPVDYVVVATAYHTGVESLMRILRTQVESIGGKGFPRIRTQARARHWPRALVMWLHTGCLGDAHRGSYPTVETVGYPSCLGDVHRGSYPTVETVGHPGNMQGGPVERGGAEQWTEPRP